MARYITLLLLIATCYAQESSNAWLDITLEKDKTPQNVESNIINKDDTIYFTIQVAARKNFPEAINVVKKLNELGFDAFIQKNDTNPKARYRIRYEISLRKKMLLKQQISLKKNWDMTVGLIK